MVSNFNDDYELPEVISMPEKISDIRDFAFTYELCLRGYTYFPSEKKWKITGKALAGHDFIKKTTSMLQTYCERVNLITTKSTDKFAREAYDMFHRVNPMCVNDVTIKADDYRSLIKIFKDRLSGIGDVLAGSRKLLGRLFVPEKEEKINDDY